MSSTRLVQHVNAPRSAVYRACADPRMVAAWMVPSSMFCRVLSFAELIPNERIVQRIELGTADGQLQGEMTVTIVLRERDGGTDVVAEHDQLPPGWSPYENELGWSRSLHRLAVLVEFERQYQRQKIATGPAIAVLVALSIVGLAYRLDILTAPIPILGWTLFGALVVLGIFAAWNWRCPACRGNLGRKLSPVVCRHCGVRLRP